MARIGSDNTFSSNNRGGVIDEQGNSVVSASTDFGASPAGKSLLTQILFGLPNGTFDLLPPDPAAIIVANENPLPYWDVQNISTMAGSAVYDSTTLNWGINLNPGTAGAGDSITMTTRSYLINDDNLGLRQKASAVISKVGTYAGTTQWNVTMTATYYDDTDTVLSTQAIGTVYDNTTWTSFNGFTTAGGAAISASASYVDLQFTLTATAAVTSATSITIKSCLLQTSVASTGSFLVADTFTSSGTWTRPTGVDYLLAVVAQAGGGGGSGGGLNTSSSVTNQVAGRGAGGGGGWYILRDLYVADQSTISVGIGAGGAGGAGGTATKASAGTATFNVGNGAGSNGGDTTFGSYFSAKGGNASVSDRTGGAASSVATTIAYGGTDALGGAGGTGPNTDTPGGAGGVSGLGTATIAPYSPAPGTASAGGSATASGGSNATVAPSAGGVGWNGGGGACGRITAASTNVVNAGGVGAGGGGGAGGQAVVYINGSNQTITVTSGAGGNGVQGGGGGGGGSIRIAASSVANYNSATITATANKAGDGGAGFLTVVYIA